MYWKYFKYICEHKWNVFIEHLKIMQIKDVLRDHNIDYDHIDLPTIKPLDYENIFKSCKKTGRLLVVDNLSHKHCSIGKDIISTLIERDNEIFKTKPCLISLPEHPNPTSFYLNKFFYANHQKILKNISELLNIKISINDKNKKILLNSPHDIPNKNFSVSKYQIFSLTPFVPCDITGIPRTPKFSYRSSLSEPS